MKKIALYSGSFDPPTNGHVDILRKSLTLADHIIIAIGIQPTKKGLFTFDERVEMFSEIARAMDGGAADRIEIIAFDGLVVDAARKANASFILRGLRNGSDLDYEMQMAGMNGKMAPDIPTIFVPASPGVGHITATLVRQIAGMRGNVEPFVPDCVNRRLLEKFAP